MAEEKAKETRKGWPIAERQKLVSETTARKNWAKQLKQYRTKS